MTSDSTNENINLSKEKVIKLRRIYHISMFYIVNSISMSVSARTKQYGAMRAVGMGGRQLTRMIAAEAFTYAISGLVVGCGIGLPLSRFLHIKLITRYFGTVWHLPVTSLCLIVAFVFVAAAGLYCLPCVYLDCSAVYMEYLETIGKQEQSNKYDIQVSNLSGCFGSEVQNTYIYKSDTWPFCMIIA